MSDEVIRAKDINKKYEARAGGVTAVDGVSLSAKTGEFISIVGPSGSGKTTLLYLLGSLESADSGEIEVAGHNIMDASIDLVTFRRNCVGFVFQFFNLVPYLTALENVMLPMDLVGVPYEKQKERAVFLLAQMGITERLLRSRPGKMSGGENQRVAIARALANDPHLILADEPTGNLDAETGKTVIEIMKRLAMKDGKCVLIVTHDESIIDETHRSYRMKDGRLYDL
ncbi:MAG: ABC transporter ATP-binding protein [Actinomycetota bacterium]|nr:ABC transporter ATP-binding protein [Actinomycetota bacterium]